MRFIDQTEPERDRNEALRSFQSRPRPVLSPALDCHRKEDWSYIKMRSTCIITLVLLTDLHSHLDVSELPCFVLSEIQ